MRKATIKQISEQATIVDKLTAAASGKQDEISEVIRKLQWYPITKENVIQKDIPAESLSKVMGALDKARTEALEAIERAIQGNDLKFMRGLVEEMEANGISRNETAAEVLGAYLRIRKNPTFKGLRDQLKKARAGAALMEDADLRKMCRQLKLTFTGKTGRPSKTVGIL